MLGSRKIAERLRKDAYAIMFDWNDLKYFLAVARCGSTVAAGKALGVNQSTVQRRLKELEDRIGRDLVARHITGYRLTSFGEELRTHAEQVEEAIRQLEQHVGDSGRNQTGVIRLTCPEPIVYRLTEFIDRFHAKHPNLRVEFVTSDRFLDLLKGEADVAFRSGDTEDDLVGRKIADSAWAVYASEAYLASRGRPTRIEELSQHSLVTFDSSMSNHRVVKWLNQVAPEASIAARNSSVLGLVYAVKSGVGIAPLPTAIGDDQKDLVRVLGPIPELSRSWRLLTLPDLRHTPRISAFFDFASDECRALRSILTG
jgi:DNA-binding transcriptional LysR family regulator